MRISDWSSDVCSSDLPAERTAATMTVMGRLLAQNLKLIRSESSPIRRRLEQMAIGAMEIPRLRRLLCAKVERYDDVPALRAALGHPEIGRASCRARVCQYV